MTPETALALATAMAAQAAATTAPIVPSGPELPDLGKPMVFSASRIETWLRCQRQAGFVYFMGYREPDTVDTKLGGDVHRALEEMGKTGRLPNMLDPIDYIAAAAVPHVREDWAKPTCTFEGEFHLRGRHAWRGCIDLCPEPGHVTDYKTTGNYKWMKTPDQLTKDAQAQLYAHKEFTVHPTLDKVILRWLYILKREPHSCRSSVASVTREHAAAKFAELERHADAMQAAAYAAPKEEGARLKYVLEMVPNYNACNMYRGCPHRAAGRCNPPLFAGTQGSFFSSSDTQAAEAAPEGTQDTMNMSYNFLSSMLAASNAENAAAGLPPVALADPHVLAPPAPTVALVTPGAPAQVPTVAVPDLDFAAAEQRARTMIQARHPAPVAAVAPVAPAAQVEPLTALPQAPVTVQAINPPKRGPGRPRKNPLPVQNEVSRPEIAPPVGVAPSVVQEIAPAVAPPAVAPPVVAPPAVAPPAVAPPAGLPIGILYVGCVPRAASPSAGATYRDQVDYIDLERLIAKARQVIGEKVYFDNYGYKANGFVVQVVSKILAELRPSAVVVSCPRSCEYILGLLKSISDVVVEAVQA